ncbi:hypothetical protein EB796_019594 [Bugula neritina]|uniref:Transglutaminase N-terminal domain-containing protein n=1 Tax=Bugula neritina TaxID=10212 RepID=A0A7J7J8P3_BUGNE|nr:hypothetical protein EB796_019594 [Bugula neritina]
MGGVYSTLSSYFDPADPPRAHRAESSVSLPGRRINTGGETCNFHESVKPPSADTPKKPKKAVEIESVDLCIDENSRDHHTADYEVCQDGYIDDLTKEVKKAQLVIRRGQTFKVKITLNDKCSEDTQFRVISTIGKIPLK